MNAGEFAKRRARIGHEAWRRSPGYAGKAMAALCKQAGAEPVKVRGKLVGWVMDDGARVCTKERYRSEEAAADVLSGIAEHDNEDQGWKHPKRHYHCQYCGGYHLTSKLSPYN